MVLMCVGEYRLVLLLSDVKRTSWLFCSCCSEACGEWSLVPEKVP